MASRVVLLANLALRLFMYKGVKHVVYFTCYDRTYNSHVVKYLWREDMRVSVISSDRTNVSQDLYRYTFPMGVLLDGDCPLTQSVLEKTSQANLFDLSHSWLVINEGNNSAQFIQSTFAHLNLSADADVVVATWRGDKFSLTDVFNFGKIQGNDLETRDFGEWSSKNGLKVFMDKYKYIYRWDFHNLTLRSITVMTKIPKKFGPEIISDPAHAEEMTVFTKINAKILDVLSEKHNFGFNYTVARSFYGLAARNSALALVNALLWGTHDISYSGIRMNLLFVDWLDFFSPGPGVAQTKFFYLIPQSGVGEFKNRFLTPLSPKVWYCTVAAAGACAVLLAVAARYEQRAEPTAYAMLTVLAGFFQEGYQDGTSGITDRVSQGGKIIIFAIGITGMLIYNYYTSSVVSWLLSASPPTFTSLDDLANSNFEIVLENTGYAKNWVELPGIYYYSGYVNPKEDRLRDKKMKLATRAVPLLCTVEEGIQHLRSGKYAFNVEPYSASELMAKSFQERELCNLGQLQMMPLTDVYILGQKHSPYKEFFNWSLKRLLERGHVHVVRSRMGGAVPPCSGKVPRALALGEAAPAFALLALASALSLVILALEILWHRYQEHSSNVLFPYVH